MISEGEMVVRLLLAAFYGSLIGFQREHHFWTAGLRTHMLVSTGACLFMIVSAFGFQQALTMPGTQLDPSRIAAACSGLTSIWMDSTATAADTTRP